MSTERLPSDFVAALTDPQITALTLWGEARGEPIEGQVAVAHVIRNRVADGRWGRDYARVCLAPWQFSCWRPEGGRSNYAALMKVAREMATSSRLPDDQALRQCAWVAQGVIGAWIADNVAGATHYLTADLFATRPPTWAVNQVPVARLAKHVFFRGIR